MSPATLKVHNNYELFPEGSEQKQSKAWPERGILPQWEDNLRRAAESATFERHYRIAELCDLWGIGRETMRKILVDEPGVVKIRLGRRKYHTTYSVPASVAERIHARLASGDDSGPRNK